MYWALEFHLIDVAWCFSTGSRFRDCWRIYLFILVVIWLTLFTGSRNRNHLELDLFILVVFWIFTGYGNTTQQLRTGDVIINYLRVLPSNVIINCLLVFALPSGGLEKHSGITQL